MKVKGRRRNARLVPWLRGRMFRTGVPLGQPIPVTDQVLTAANAITLARLLGLPLFVYLIMTRRDWLAGVLLLSVMAVLDALDGYVARRFGQSSRLGKTLDPWTDRLTMATACVTLVAAKAMPLWAGALIVARDLLLLAVVGGSFLADRSVPFSRLRVTRTGKLATAALLAGVPVLMLSRARVPGAGLIRYGALGVIFAGLSLYYVSLAQHAKAEAARFMSARAGRRRIAAPAAGTGAAPER